MVYLLDCRYRYRYRFASSSGADGPRRALRAHPAGGAGLRHIIKLIYNMSKYIYVYVYIYIYTHIVYTYICIYT